MARVPFLWNELKLGAPNSIGAPAPKTNASPPASPTLLEPVPELSYGDEQTENMLIQGDNLEALKALLPFYAGPRQVHLHRPALQHPQRLRALQRQPGTHPMARHDLSPPRT